MRINDAFRGLTQLGCSAALLLMVGVSREAFADAVDYQGPYAKLLGGLNFALDSDFDGNTSLLAKQAYPPELWSD